MVMILQNCPSKRLIGVRSQYREQIMRKSIHAVITSSNVGLMLIARGRDMKNTMGKSSDDEAENAKALLFFCATQESRHAVEA